MRTYQSSTPVTRGETHNGIRISAKSPGAGIKPPTDGNGFFLFLLQKNIHRVGDVYPGCPHLYFYWPRQRSQWGDLWFPDGWSYPMTTLSGTRVSGSPPQRSIQISNFCPTSPRSEPVVPFELMVKANTPGKNDGEAKFWIDGKVAAISRTSHAKDLHPEDRPRPSVVLHAQHSERVNKKVECRRTSSSPRATSSRQW